MADAPSATGAVAGGRPVVDAPSATRAFLRPPPLPPAPWRPTSWLLAAQQLAASPWDYGRCKLCGKQNTPEHLAGKAHSKAEEEARFLDGILGSSVVGRSLGSVGEKPLHGDLQWERLVAHWGEHLGDMATRVKAIIAVQGAKAGKRQLPVSPEALEGARLLGGVVSYNGQGKYTERDLWIPFEAVPGYPRRTLRLQDLPEDACPSSSAGWWPAVAISHSGEELGLGEVVLTVGGVLCAVCVMQWGWPEPTGWWVTVAPLSRL